MATVKKLIRMQIRKAAVLVTAALFVLCSMAGAQKNKVSVRLNNCITKVIKNPFSTLAEEELAYLSAAEIKLLNNFIYTRRYTELREPVLAGYFTASDNVLTATIKQDSNFVSSTAYNIELLQAFYNKDSLILIDKEKFDSVLNGYWQQGTAVIAATMLTNYHFLQDNHSFLFEQKNAGASDGLINYSGFYTYTATGIELEIRTKTLFKTEGVNRSASKSVKANNLINSNKETVVHLDDAYEYKIITLSPVYSIKFDGIEKHYCRINEKIFWKCYPAE
jgi:hypothetical protein